MSLSFPEHLGQASMPRALLSGLALAGIMVAAPTQAAQTHLQPSLEASVEQNTNRNLAINPADEADITGYIVDAQLLWSYVTPQTETQVRPRVRFQNYPDDKEIQSSEQFLDFNTRHRATERSTLELVGRYSRQDSFNSELGEAGFDDLDPDDPTEGGEGVDTLSSQTRTRAQLRPGFTHEFSEVTGFFVGSILETVRFDSDTQDRTEFDYLELRTLVTRQLSPLTQLAIGPVASRYETRDDVNQTDSYGLELNLDHRWSDVTRVGGGVFVRSTDVELTEGGTTESDSTTDVGFDFNVLRRTETGRVRFRAGRTLRPSTTGNLVIRDELRLQYDHDFSERLSMTTAVRASTEETQGTSLSNRDRDYARAELGLTWMLTPTMFVRGAYQYTWREIAEDDTSAKNHAAIVSFGYRGLARPR
jgi:hypothetical protein